MVEKLCDMDDMGMIFQSLGRRDTANEKMGNESLHDYNLRVTSMIQP